MGRRSKFILLIVACLAGVVAIKMIAMPSPHDPRSELQVALARMVEIETALADFAATNARYPIGDDWADQLGLTAAQVADPFSAPPDSESFTLWSDGRWHVLISYGPDGGGTPLRYFHEDFLSQATPREVERLLGDDEIVGDIRYRSAIYDPTNGLLTWGDLVHWGGPATERIAPAQSTVPLRFTASPVSPETGP